MASPEYLGGGTPDGEVLGRSSGKVGFYGLATPITKPSVTRQTTKTSTALRADIDRVSTALVNLGLITVT